MYIYIYVRVQTSGSQDYIETRNTYRQRVQRETEKTREIERGEKRETTR